MGPLGPGGAHSKLPTLVMGSQQSQTVCGLAMLALLGTSTYGFYSCTSTKILINTFTSRLSAILIINTPTNDPFGMCHCTVPGTITG